MTKPITGVAAMILVESGRLALDQPVADVLPEFRALRVATDLQKGLESRPAAKTMTMRHLLTHTSGLSYWTPPSSVGALPMAYRERGITPGNYGAGLSRPGPDTARRQRASSRWLGASRTFRSRASRALRGTTLLAQTS